MRASREASEDENIQIRLKSARLSIGDSFPSLVQLSNSGKLTQPVVVQRAFRVREASFRGRSKPGMKQHLGGLVDKLMSTAQLSEY